MMCVYLCVYVCTEAWARFFITVLFARGCCKSFYCLCSFEFLQLSATVM